MFGHLPFSGAPHLNSMDSCKVVGLNISNGILRCGNQFKYSASDFSQEIRYFGFKRFDIFPVCLAFGVVVTDSNSMRVISGRN